MYSSVGNVVKSIVPQDKTEQRVFYTNAVFKLALILVSLMVLGSIRSSKIFHTWSLKGLNPSNFCLTDPVHGWLMETNIRLLQTPFLRDGLQIMSSLLIDSAFIYNMYCW